MSLTGTYVRTFAEATHALPDGMHMNSDYPFKLPKIVGRGNNTITIQGRDGTATVTIKRDRRGEYAEIAQSSAFEKLYRTKPTTFRLSPFKDHG